MNELIQKIRKKITIFRLRVRHWGGRHIRSRIPNHLYWLYTDVDTEIIGLLDALIVQLLPIYFAYIGNLWLAIGTAITGRLLTSRLSRQKQKRDRKHLIKDTIEETKQELQLPDQLR
jgi:hypothetical protein